MWLYRLWWRLYIHIECYGGKSNSSIGGNVASGGSDGNDAGLGNGGISGAGGNAGSGGATTSSGDAGAAGSSGYASMSCADLQTAYTTEMTLAKTCSTGGSNTCTQTVPDALNCDCSVFVSVDRTGAISAIEQISGVLKSKSCLTGIACTGACAVPSSATCVASATTGKSGVCTASTS